MVDLTEADVRSLVHDRPELNNFLSSPESIPAATLERSANENWQKTALKLLNQCSRLKGHVWFTEPVDPVKFGIMDYFDIISQPMDLGTLRRRLSHNCYLHREEFCR